MKTTQHKGDRLLRKLALEREVRGDMQRRTGVYTRVHEDSSTVSTKQFASGVEFPKKSNTNQDQAFKSLITRMENCVLAANASKSIYIEYSKKLKNNKRLNEITTLLSEMLDNHIFPNTVIINQIISILSRRYQLRWALAFHTLAVAKGLANAITYNSTLDAIAKSEQPDAKLAVLLLNEAKANGLADAITYASTLDAIAKSEQPDRTLAATLIDEAVQQFHLFDLRKGTFDLHGLSFGMVYFGLKRYLEQRVTRMNSDSDSITLIYGKGLHSRAEGIHPVKQAVLQVVKELSQKGVSGKEHINNPGVFDLFLQSPLKHQSNALNPNRLFPPTRLNPNATPFVSKLMVEKPPF